MYTPNVFSRFLKNRRVYADSRVILLSVVFKVRRREVERGQVFTIGLKSLKPEMQNRAKQSVLNFLDSVIFWAKHFAASTVSYHSAHVNYIIAHWETNTENCPTSNIFLALHWG